MNMFLGDWRRKSRRASRTILNSARRNQRRLVAEPLEPRLLLAGDPVDDLARFRLETADFDGTPISEIELGAEFLLNVFVEDLRTLPSPDDGGLFSAYLDIEFDPSLISPVTSETIPLGFEIEFNPIYSNRRRGNIATSGVIDEVGSVVNSFDPIGQNERPFFRILFTADAVGTVTFSSNFADNRDNEVLPFDEFEPLDPEQIDFGTISVTIVRSGLLETSLVLDPTPTFSNGEINVLPDDVEFIHEWQPFTLEIWVSAPGSDLFGVATASTVVGYNTDFFTADPMIEFGPAFTVNQASGVDDDAGRITIAATTERTDVGDDRRVLLARVHFEPTGTDPGVPILLNAPVPVAPVDEAWIGLVDDVTEAVELTTVGSVRVDKGEAPTTDLYPLLYDLDDDGRISFSDLAQFASVFLSDVNVVPQAAKSDFDASGRVNFTDFAFLAVNFLKNRDSSSSIVFPNNFPDDFGAQMLVVDGAGGPQVATAPLTDDQAAAIAAEAAARLGASADAVTVEVVDLPGDLLGRASAGTIQLDIDAAGYGWFVDTTPSDDVEFSTEIGMTELTATDDSEAARRVDLLTVVMHELGHVLGHNHTTSHSLMDGSLPLGTRRLAGDDGDSNGDADDHSLSGTLVDDFFATLDN